MPKPKDEDVEEFKRMKRMKGKDVWEVMRSYPDGVKVPCSVLAALPVTQVSIERLFSAMKLLLTDLQSGLKPDVVEAMLVLCTNLL